MLAPIAQQRVHTATCPHHVPCLRHAGTTGSTQPRRDVQADAPPRTTHHIAVVLAQRSAACQRQQNNSSSATCPATHQAVWQTVPGRMHSIHTNPTCKNPSRTPTAVHVHAERQHPTRYTRATIHFLLLCLQFNCKHRVCLPCLTTIQGNSCTPTENCYCLQRQRTCTTSEITKKPAGNGSCFEANREAGLYPAVQIYAAKQQVQPNDSSIASTPNPCKQCWWMLLGLPMNRQPCSRCLCLHL